MVAALRPVLLLLLALASSPAAAGDAPPAPGPLPDIVQGSASAPVTIVEYASMTCTHCARFHEAVWPEIKSKYVDAGRARFVLREFPLDPLAAAAFMLGRCAGADKRDLLLDRLFAQQKTWAFVAKPAEPLFSIAATVGLSRTAFEACLHDEGLYDRMSESRRQAQALGVDSTPTFFVDGAKLTGEASVADFDQAIAAARR